MRTTHCLCHLFVILNISQCKCCHMVQMWLTMTQTFPFLQYEMFMPAVNENIVHTLHFYWTAHDPIPLQSRNVSKKNIRNTSNIHVLLITCIQVDRMYPSFEGSALQFLTHCTVHGGRFQYLRLKDLQYVTFWLGLYGRRTNVSSLRHVDIWSRHARYEVEKKTADKSQSKTFELLLLPYGLCTPHFQVFC